MSRNACLVIAVFTVLAVAACTRAPMPPDQSRTQSTTEAAPLPGETVAQLVALDQEAIALAAQAREHDQLDEPVAALAEKIYMHHRRNLTQTRALGDAEALNVTDTPAIRNQRMEEEKRLKTLGDVDADAYQRHYLEAVVDTHEHALELIDEHMKATGNDNVRKHLERTRGNYAEHLETATALRGN